jgi:hypothetical protein
VGETFDVSCSGVFVWEGSEVWSPFKGTKVRSPFKGSEVWSPFKGSEVWSPFKGSEVWLPFKGSEVWLPFMLFSELDASSFLCACSLSTCFATSEKGIVVRDCVTADSSSPPTPLDLKKVAG